MDFRMQDDEALVCQKKLFKLAVALTHGDVDLAEDFVQTAYCKFYEEKNKCREIQNVTAWLYHVLRNVACDHYRNESKMQIISLDDESNFEERNRYEPFDFIEERLAISKEEKMIHDIFSRLSENEKFLYECRVEKHMSYEEIERLSGEKNMAIRKQYERLHEQIVSEIRKILNNV